MWLINILSFSTSRRYMNGLNKAQFIRGNWSCSSGILSGRFGNQTTANTTCSRISFKMHDVAFHFSLMHPSTMKSNSHICFVTTASGLCINNCKIMFVIIEYFSQTVTLVLNLVHCHWFSTDIKNSNWIGYIQRIK